MWDKFAELLVTLWEIVKIDSPSYRNIERSFLASNSDSSGLLLKGHLTRYWNFVSPSSNRKTYYSILRFFTFLKSRNEALINWGVWAVLVFFEHRRTELLEQYDERVAKQKRLEQKGGPSRSENPISPVS